MTCHSLSLSKSYHRFPERQRRPWWWRAGLLLGVFGLHLAGLLLAFGVVTRPDLPLAASPLRVRVVEASPTPPRVMPPQRAMPSRSAPARTPPPAKALAAPRLLSAGAPTASALTIAPPSPTQEHAPAAVEAPMPTAPAPLVAARFDADYLHNPRPVYPETARRQGQEGRVLLRVRVGANGLPLAVEIKQSSGFWRLDEAARAAVERWRFVPARRGEEAVESSVLVPLQFTLES